MGIIKTVTKNSLIIMSSKIIVRILSLVFVIFVARYLGDSGFGKYSFVFAFLSFFAVFITFGMDTLIIREVAKDKSKSNTYLVNTAVLKGLFSVTSWLIILILIYLLNKGLEINLGILIISFCLLLDAIVGSFRSIFLACERMELNILIDVSVKFIIVSLGLLFVFLDFGLVAIFFASLFASTYSLFLSIYLYNKNISSLEIKVDKALVKSLLKKSYPFALAGIFVVMYYRIDTVMLSFMIGDAPVGWYSAAYALTEALLFIPTIVCIAIFPVLSRLFNESKESFAKAYEYSFRFLLLLGIPIAFGTTILANKIILLIYKEGFSNSIIALRILIWAIALAFLNSIMGFVLYAVNKEKIVFKIAGSLVLLNTILNFLFIPKYSYIAASFTTVATELVGFICYFGLISKYIYRLRITGFLLKALFSAIAMGVLIYQLSNLNLFILIFSGGLIYFVALMILNAFSREDKRLFRKLVSFGR